MNTEAYKDQAVQASNNLSELQSSAPNMLNQLKSNLVGIFSKNNPVMQARETALQDYLNSPSSTRASTLPSNLPMVEGSNLTLSPTQQNAITTARSNAALVPLAGLNQIITGQYGTIGDIVQGASAAYGSSIDAAKARVSNLIDLYKVAVAEEDARNKAASSSSGIDLAAIINAIRATNGTQIQDSRPPLEQFDQPDDIVLPDPVTGQPTTLNLNIPAVPNRSSTTSQPTSTAPTGLNLSGYDFSNTQTIPQQNQNGLSLFGINLNPFAGLGLNFGGNK